MCRTRRKVSRKSARGRRVNAEATETVSTMKNYAPLPRFTASLWLSHIDARCVLRVRNGIELEIHRKQKFYNTSITRAVVRGLDVHFVLLLPSWVLLQDNEALQHMREGDVLLGCELSAFCCTEPYRRGVRLEARNSSWLAGLTNDVDRLTNAHRDRSIVQLLVQRHQESGVHRRDQEVEHPVVTVKDDYMRTSV